MKSNTDYKNASLAALKGNWGKAVLATVIYVAILYIAMGPMAYNQAKLQMYVRENIPQTSTANIGSAMRQAAEASLTMAQDPEFIELQTKSNGSMGLYYLVWFFLVMPLMVGYANAFRLLVTQGDREVPSNMYKMATKGYWHKVWGMFLMTLFTSLWMLLFIIPGIVKMFSYAMTPYILEEHPELSANEAIDRSRAMMKGHKFDLFWLYLSFIGWGILSLFTFGLGGLWLGPYVQGAHAAFYEDVKADYEVNGGLI